MALDPAEIDYIHMLEDGLELENVTDEGDEARFSCPFPGHTNGDQNASAYINQESGAWICFGCKERGEVIGLCARVLEVSPLEAARLLREAYMPGHADPDSRNMLETVRHIWRRPEQEQAHEPTVIEDEVYEEHFAVDWQMVVDTPDAPAALTYMLRRGFEARTLIAWDFGYDEISNRIVFAVRDIGGTIIGVKGRSWNDRQPKYLVIGDRPHKPLRYGWPCYSTGSVVFGLHRAHVEDTRHLVICEGELNAIACYEAGHPGVAINGSNFTTAQARLIKQEADYVTLFLDDDNAGRTCLWGTDDTKGVVEALSGDLTVAIVSGHDRDPAEMTKEEIDQRIQSAQPATLARVLLGSQ